MQCGMCIWCSLKACPVTGAIDVAQEPARSLGESAAGTIPQPSIFTIHVGTTAAPPPPSFFIITTSCSLTNTRTRYTTASDFYSRNSRLCLSPTSLLRRDKRTAEASLSAPRQHLEHRHKTDWKQAGREILGGRRAEEPGFHAQRRLLVLEAQEKKKKHRKRAISS